MQPKAHKTTRKQRFSKALVALIALLVLNCSVDTAYDPVAMTWDGEEYVEDMSFNDIESIYELVTECWMDLEDFVPEQDDQDGYELGKTIKDWIAAPYLNFSLQHKVIKRYYVPHMIPTYPSVSGEIDIPPPDQLS